MSVAFSVIVPVYNAEAHVRHTLDSVLAQTFCDWECVCVDDGSTDGSGAILDEYAAKDPRFRVVHQKNGGEGAARNAGMDAAHGEMMAFLDSDDAWHLETLRLFAEARARTGADVIRYGWRHVESHANGFTPLSVGDVRIESVDFGSRRESTIRFCALGAATVVSRSACGDLRFTHLAQGADLVFVLDSLLRSRKVAYVDAPLLHYLVHSGQISRRVSESLVLGTCGYLPEIAERCARLGETPEAWADTRRYICDIVFRRLVGAWRLFKGDAVRETVRGAFWECLERLAEIPGFFSQVQGSLVALACRRKSVLFLCLFAAWPYRLLRKMV